METWCATVMSVINLYDDQNVDNISSATADILLDTPHLVPPKREYSWMSTLMSCAQRPTDKNGEMRTVMLR